jgi:Tol biopolymer transport system component
VQTSPGADEVIYTSAGTLFSTDLAGNPAEKLEGSFGRDWFPTASPNHTQLAFWSMASGAFELWHMDLSSGRRRQLTYFNEASVPTEMQNFSLHNAPAWSPDGRRIAFSFYGKLWIIEATGFNLETILPEGQNLSPAWSADGTLLAYISEKAHKGRNLYLLKLGTSENWALTNFPTTQRVSGPTWSPHGNKIAFTVSTGEETDIWMIHADGSHLTRLTQDKRSHSPAWAPDGKHLAFASGRQDLQHWEIWIMNADGSGAFSLTRNGGFSPTWRRIQTSGLPIQRPVSKTMPELPKLKPTEQVPAARVPQALATRVPQALATRVPQALATRVPQAQATRVPQAQATHVPQAQATLVPQAQATHVPQAQAAQVAATHPPGICR